MVAVGYAPRRLDVDLLRHLEFAVHCVLGLGRRLRGPLLQLLVLLIDLLEVGRIGFFDGLANLRTQVPRAFERPRDADDVLLRSGELRRASRV